VGAYNYFISLLTALRKVRLAAAMEFVNGVVFAALGIVMLLTWRCGLGKRGDSLRRIVPAEHFGRIVVGKKRHGRPRPPASNRCPSGACGPS